MTKANIALAELAEKVADADLIKEALRFALQQLMDMDVEALCKAAYGARTEDRANSRNGSMATATGCWKRGLAALI